jgi:hypothetical protein
MQYSIFLIMSENTNKKEDVAPSTSEDEKPHVDDYLSKDKELASDRKSGGHICDDCGKSFPTPEELTIHYKKEHPESF